MKIYDLLNHFETNISIDDRNEIISDFNLLNNKSVTSLTEEPEEAIIFLLGNFIGNLAILGTVTSKNAIQDTLEIDEEQREQFKLSNKFTARVLHKVMSDNHTDVIMNYINAN